MWRGCAHLDPFRGHSQTMAGEKKVLILCALVVILWLLVGTFVYKIAGNCSTNSSCTATGELVETEVCGWTFEESFYYAVQAGLSIGFGLLPENQEGSRAYTIFHIMAGSSMVGGVLAFFVTMLITRHREHHDRSEKILTRYCSRLHVDGYKGFTLDELRPLMRRHPRFYRDILELVETDRDLVDRKMDEYKQMTPPLRNKAVDTLIKQAHGQVESLKGGRLSIDELEKLNEEERGYGRKIKKYVIDNWSFVMVWCAFSFWMLLGTIYGLAAEKWTFIQSVYFAVSSCSTGGLQSVTRSSWCVLFAGFYSLVGVPMYAAALGTFANIVVDKYNDKIFNEKMNAKFEAAEVQFVEHVNGHGDTEYMDQTEFMEVQLLKLGNVDGDLLKQLRDQFKELDKHGNGRIRKELLISDDKRRIQRVNKQRAKEQP